MGSANTGQVVLSYIKAGWVSPEEQSSSTLPKASDSAPTLFLPSLPSVMDCYLEIQDAVNHLLLQLLLFMVSYPSNRKVTKTHGLWNAALKVTAPVLHGLSSCGLLHMLMVLLFFIHGYRASYHRAYIGILFPLSDWLWALTQIK